MSTQQAFCVFLLILLSCIAGKTPADLGFRTAENNISHIRRILSSDQGLGSDQRILLEGIKPNEVMEGTHRYCLKLQQSASLTDLEDKVKRFGRLDDVQIYKHVGIICVTLSIRDARTLLVEEDNTSHISFAHYDSWRSRKSSSSSVTLTSQECEDLMQNKQDVPNTWFLDRINQLIPQDDGNSTPTISSTNEVHVFIMDTGINGDLPEFLGHLADLDEHASSVYYLDSSNLCEYDPLCDLDGHGTHVAGIAAGINGYNPNAILHSIKVLSAEGFGSTESVIAGCNIVTQIATERGYKAVMNASLGGEKSYMELTAFEDLYHHGVLAVVAAGNETADACGSTPASTKHAVTVGATNLKCTKTGEDQYQLQDTISSFSNYGDCVDIYAPGTNIWSSDTHTPGHKINFDGTSMASPLVAGVASAIFAKYADWNADQVRQYLISISQKNVITNISANMSNHLLNDLETLKCEDGYFESNNRCEKCDPGCKICTGSEPHECTECFPTAFQFDCSGHTVADFPECGASFFCTYHCPLGYYEDTATSTCKKCAITCEGCSGPSGSDCTSCPNNKLLHKNVGSCVDSCPATSYNVGSTCINCASAATPRDYGDDTSEVAFYDADTDFTCYKCDRNCSTCGYLAYDCYSCHQFSLLFQGNGYYFCAGGCPSGYYYESRGCKSCFENCLKCSGPSAKDCTSCGVGLVLATSGDCIEGDCFNPMSGVTVSGLNPIIIESAHPYCNGVDYVEYFSFSNTEVTKVKMEFHANSEMEENYDTLQISRDLAKQEILRDFSSGTVEDFEFTGDSFFIHFSADNIVNYYGFKIIVTPLKGSSSDNDGEEQQQEEDETNQQEEQLQKEEEEEEDVVGITCTEFSKSVGAVFEGVEPQVVDSPHPYCNEMFVVHSYEFSQPTVRQIEIRFSNESQLELEYDYLILAQDKHFVNILKEYRSNDFIPFTIDTHKFFLKFASDESVSRNGFTMHLTPIEGEPRNEDPDSDWDSDDHGEVHSCSSASKSSLVGYKRDTTQIKSYLRSSVSKELSVALDISTPGLDLSHFLLFVDHKNNKIPITLVWNKDAYENVLALFPLDAITKSGCVASCNNAKTTGESCELSLRASHCSLSHTVEISRFQLDIATFKGSGLAKYINVNILETSTQTQVTSAICKATPDLYTYATLTSGNISANSMGTAISINLSGKFQPGQDQKVIIHEAIFADAGGNSTRIFNLEVSEDLNSLIATFRAPKEAGDFVFIISGSIISTLQEPALFYSSVELKVAALLEEETPEEQEEEDDVNVEPFLSFSGYSFNLPFFSVTFNITSGTSEQYIPSLLYSNDDALIPFEISNRSATEIELKFSFQDFSVQTGDFTLISNSIKTTSYGVKFQITNNDLPVGTFLMIYITTVSSLNLPVSQNVTDLPPNLQSLRTLAQSMSLEKIEVVSGERVGQREVLELNLKDSNRGIGDIAVYVMDSGKKINVIAPEDVIIDGRKIQFHLGNGNESFQVLVKGTLNDNDDDKDTNDLDSTEKTNFWAEYNFEGVEIPDDAKGISLIEESGILNQVTFAIWCGVCFMTLAF